MSKIKLLIAFDQILGYSDYKEVIKEFIKDNDIKKYRIEKIDKIPEEIESEMSVKELYYDDYYGCIVSEDLLHYASTMVHTYAENFLSLEEQMRYIMEYVKLEPHEADMIFEMYHHVMTICSDTIGINEDSAGGFYADYYDVGKLIKRYLEGL